MSLQKKIDNLITIKKGIFTSCNSDKKCPPWSLQADEVKHDSTKKQLIYENVLLKIYDFPILYFQNFFILILVFYGKQDF